jgi:hypothetical protein
LLKIGWAWSGKNRGRKKKPDWRGEVYSMSSSLSKKSSARGRKVNLTVGPKNEPLIEKLKPQSAETNGTDLQAVQEMPLDARERHDLRESRRVNLNQMFEETLSKQDRDLWRDWQKPDGQRDDTASELRIFGKFDDFILRISRTLGWQVFLSDVIVNRIAQWWHKKRNGPELLERLGRELALGARVGRGLVALPMDDQAWHAIRDTAKCELRPLLNKLRNTFGPGNSLPNTEQILSFVS